MDDYLIDLLPESVSSGDAGSSVSSGDNITVNYQVIYTVSGSDAADPQYTLFNKPLDEYTVSEGLLLIIVVLVLGKFVWNVIKEGFKFWSW